MRYKPEHKDETHRRIVESAASEFKCHGFEGIGIAKLMNALQLTHGGFYAHFSDKEGLVAEASVAALEQSLQTILTGLKMGGFPAVIDYYLSEEQRDDPASACMLPSLAAEMARRPLPSRRAYTEKLTEVFTAIAEQMPGKTPERKFEKVCAMFAALMGAVSLARSVSDPTLSKIVLQSTRDCVLKMIEETDE